MEGKYCDRCKPGHFGLKEDLLEGCFPCYCSGVTTLCESAILSSRKVEDLYISVDLYIHLSANDCHFYVNIIFSTFGLIESGFSADKVLLAMTTERIKTVKTW